MNYTLKIGQCLDDLLYNCWFSTAIAVSSEPKIFGSSRIKLYSDTLQFVFDCIVHACMQDTFCFSNSPSQNNMFLYAMEILYLLVKVSLKTYVTNKNCIIFGSKLSEQSFLSLPRLKEFHIEIISKASYRNQRTLRNNALWRQ